MNPSIILAIWQVSDIGLRSFAIDCGGYCLGKGRTIALFRRPGMNLSLSDVLYKATLESKGLQYAVWDPIWPAPFIALWGTKCPVRLIWWNKWFGRYIRDVNRSFMNISLSWIKFHVFSVWRKHEITWVFWYWFCSCAANNKISIFLKRNEKSCSNLFPIKQFLVYISLLHFYSSWLH